MIINKEKTNISSYKCADVCYDSGINIKFYYIIVKNACGNWKANNHIRMKMMRMCVTNQLVLTVNNPPLQPPITVKSA